MSNSEENTEQEDNNAENKDTTAISDNKNPSFNSSKSNFEEICKAQLEAENAIVEAIQGISSSIKP